MILIYCVLLFIAGVRMLRGASLRLMCFATVLLHSLFEELDGVGVEDFGYAVEGCGGVGYL